MEQPGVEIYPLSRYYFGAKDARSRSGETAADRALRLKANFAEHGLCTSVHGILLVELSDHPHLLLLQVRNSSFLLPGGRLRPGEQDVQGLKRKLSSKLSAGDHPATESEDDGWQIGECVGMWWISEFDAVPFPYLLPKSLAPKLKVQCLGTKSKLRNDNRDTALQEAHVCSQQNSRADEQPTYVGIPVVEKSTGLENLVNSDGSGNQQYDEKISTNGKQCQEDSAMLQLSYALQFEGNG